MLQLDLLRICVTGGAGFLGHHVIACLKSRGVRDEQILIPRRKQFDLTQERHVIGMYETLRPDVVIHLAAEVGGIGANLRNPGRFFYANMAMGLHLIDHARRRGVRQFVQVGTVCSYPKHCKTPFIEDDLWMGFPEETSAPYAIAKKALYVMLDAYKSQYQLSSTVVIPTNLYGPFDNFAPDQSHVIPAIIHRIDLAQRQGWNEIECWGTGNASREFLYVEDAAEAVVRAAERVHDPQPINLGTGVEIAVRDLASQIASIMDYKGSIRWDKSKPDGQPRRCVDTTRAKAKLDWSPRITLADGLPATINWFRANRSSAAGPMSCSNIRRDSDVN